MTKIGDLIRIEGATRRRMLLAAIVGIAGALSALAIPSLAGMGVAQLGDPSALVVTLVAIMGLLALRLVFEVVQRLLAGKARFGVVKELRDRWFGKILSIPPGAEGETPRQEWVSLLSYDAPRIAEFVVDTPLALVASTVTLIGASAAMFLLDPRLTLAVLILAPLAYLAARFAAIRLRRRAAEYWDLEIEVMNRADDAFRARWVVQAFDQEPRLRREFAAKVAETEAAAVRHLQLTSVVGPMTQFVSFAGMVGIVVVAASLDLRLAPGELLSFVLYGLLLSQPLRAFADGLGLWHEVNATLGRFDGVTDAVQRAPTSSGEPAAPYPESVGLCLRGISFGWREPLFEDAHLVVAPGEHVALVGPNGAGKTTLISLLLGLVEPTAGTIELDGLDLATLSSGARRRMFAVVPQQPMLIGRTIRECVAFGRPQASTREVRDALEAALALDFVDALPDGLDSLVGEEGVRLSGGERQRLAVARALLLDTPVVVFDEPTASYDQRSTQLFVERAGELLAGRTVLWITHEQAPLAHTDRVVRLKDRRFRAVSAVEPGTGLGSGIAQ